MRFIKLFTQNIYLSLTKVSTALFVWILGIKIVLLLKTYLVLQLTAIVKVLILLKTF